MGMEIRTVCDVRGVPVLEIVKDDMLVVYEADDMDRQIQFSASLISGTHQLSGEPQVTEFCRPAAPSSASTALDRAPGLAAFETRGCPTLPPGLAKGGANLCRPRGTRVFLRAHPRLKPWAIIFRPSARDSRVVTPTSGADSGVRYPVLRPRCSGCDGSADRSESRRVG